MNKEKMKVLAAEIARDLKTPEDLSALSAQLTKIRVEAALNAELEHLRRACSEAILGADFYFRSWGVGTLHIDTKC